MTPFSQNIDERSTPPILEQYLFVCRNDCEKLLLEEIAFLFNKTAPPSNIPIATVTRNGMVLLSHLNPAEALRLSQTELVFERQRLPDVRSLPVDSIKTCAQTIIQTYFPRIDQADAPWTIHAFTPDVEECKPLRSRIKLVESAILEKLKKRFGRMFRRYQPAQTLQGKENYWILQICMDTPDHAYLAIGQKTPLIHAYPGGEQRMPFDSGSPSRSYLKLSEALTHMRSRPLPGQSAVDLGAAPGGWTYYLVKQGCLVTAVDNGPLKIKSNTTSHQGSFTVVKADGMRFKPTDTSYDWLCCDMLVPPRQTLELLSKWLEHRWMKSFVVNMKLPQKNPIAIIHETQEFLATQNLVYYKIKQLYHDREEVTIVGETGEK